MTINDVIENWNSQADEFNKWDSLDEEEKINHTVLMCASKAYDAAQKCDIGEKVSLAIHDAVLYT